VIAILAVLYAMVLPAPSSKRLAQRIYCVNNLKQVGLACNMWAQGNGGRYPTAVSIADGGTLGLTGTDEAWRTYQVLSNQLGTPKLLFCPAEQLRITPATNFSTDLKGKISYFVGLDAATNQPESILSGDDNLAMAGQPVETGLISVASNSPVTWTATRHNRTGNIGLADGSVQSLTENGLVKQLGQTGSATNRMVMP
jgi:prepilin-type processing-associated H-X9-DG protein